MCTININKSEIADVLTTALEGGSNYWYLLPKLSQYFEVNKDLFIQDQIVDAIFDNGISIPVYDIESPSDKLGFLNKNNIERGLKIYKEDGRVFSPDMDADEADVFFQFVVMGEIVFG